MIVLDTSVLIDYARSSLRAHAYMRSIAVDQPLTTHPVAIAELLVGSRDRRDLRTHVAMWRRLRVVGVTDHDFQHALRLLAKHHLADATGWPDCIIAATCLRLGASLATLNVKHFKAFRGLRVDRPY